MEQAYTDRDVRESPSLKEVAEKYVLEYKGSFHPILDCKERMAKGLDLEVAHIRLVLNTMRADPRVELLPQVERTDNVVPFIPRQRRSIEFDFEDISELPNFGTRRRAYFDIPTRIKYPYAMSMHKRSEVIHEVDLERSTFRYFTGSEEFQLNLHYQCRSEYLKRIKVRFLTDWERSQLIAFGLMRPCPACVSIKAARAVRNA